MNQPVTSASAIASVPTATSGPAASNASGNTSGTGSNTILLPHPPPSLSAQAAGQVVRAVVVGPTADGQVIVDTRFGKFALLLADSPPPGSVLQLQIVKPGTPVELVLIGGHPRESGLPPSPVIRLAQPPPALLTLTNGELFRGVVAGTAPDGKTLVDSRFGQLALQLAGPLAKGVAVQLQIVKSGEPLDLRLVSADAPNSGRGPAAPGGATATLSVGASVFGRFAPTAGAAATPAALAAGGFHAKIVALHPAAPAGAHAGDEAVVTGRVISSQAGGPTTIETAAGRIVLPAAGGVPAGRFITLRILAEPGTVLPTNPGGAQLRSLMNLSQSWPALEELIDTLRATNPQLAAQFAASALPNTGVTLSAGIALFLVLLTRGQLTEWLSPEVVRALESGNRQALLGRLGDDLGQMVRLAGDPANGDWRVAMLPLLHDGSLQQIRLYLRKRHGEGDSEELGTRFVIEASLSRLGNIQLDGLVQSGRFDLMVRTQAELPADMRTEIANIFDAANAESQVAGRINFQVQAHFPVDPVDEISDHAVGVYA